MADGTPRMTGAGSGRILAAGLLHARHDAVPCAEASYHPGLAGANLAIYKTLFDARRKLRAALVTDGYLGQDTTGWS